MFFGRADTNRNRTVFATVLETRRRYGVPYETEHSVEMKFFQKKNKVEAVYCASCAETKARCTVAFTFVDFLELYVPDRKSKKVVPEEATQEKIVTRECYVLVKKENIAPEPASAAPVAPKALTKVEKTPVAPKTLTKVKKEPIPITAVQLESAQKLSMFSLIKEYEGNNPEDFLKLCTDRMVRENNCSSIELLTIEQADTDLWHELRKGRITASRMHEASRCTMLNGSLTNKIMGP